MTVNRVIVIMGMGFSLASVALGRGQAPSLQEQIDVATRSGVGELIIPPGEYVFPTGLTIRDANNFTLRGSGDVRILVANTDDAVVRIVASTNVRISNLYLSHVKPKPTYECHGPVLAIEGGAHISVLESELRGCGAIGINARDVVELVVRQCNIRQNTFNAFYLSQCRVVKVIGNRIEDNANLMALYGVDDLDMSDNLIQNNGGYWRSKVEKPGRTPPEKAPGASEMPYIVQSRPSDEGLGLTWHRCARHTLSEPVILSLRRIWPPNGKRLSFSARILRRCLRMTKEAVFWDDKNDRLAVRW